MQPGQLLYIPGAGTFTVVGTPTDPHIVALANSGDPSNAPVGTQVAGGNLISPANLRGPAGVSGPVGPQGPPGPQGVSGASAFSTLKTDFTIPAAQGVAFVIDASAFSVGLIVYLAAGGYFSVVNRDTVANTLTLQNQNLPGGAPVGTVISAGATVSGTGPQGPVGPAGPQGPVGPQGVIGVAPTGAMFLWPTPTPPGGYLLCDGTPVSRTQYSALFSIIGTSYNTGGEDPSSFRVPNLSGRFPLGTSPSHVLASVGGEETHTLVLAELAAHYHTIPASGNHQHSATEADHYHLLGNHTHLGVNHQHDLQNHTHLGIDHLHSLSNHTHSYNQFGSVAAGAGLNMTAGGGAWIGNVPSNTGGPSFNATGAADRNLTTYGPNINNTGAADRDLTTTGPNPNNTNWLSQTMTLPTIYTSWSGNIGPTNSDYSGSGAAHNNMPTYLTVNYVIKT
jgi:microcystin-dependent protein